MRCEVRKESWAMRTPFRISGHVWDAAELVVVEIGDDDGAVGRGEACGVYYRNDTASRIVEDLESIRREIESGIDRAALQQLLPACGARNALDCALWELEARRAGQPVWRLAGLQATRSLLTTYTIGAADPAVMASGAKAFADARAIKLKLTGDDADAERVAAVRSARPDVWLGVDANQGFTPTTLHELLPALLEADVRLVEQPFPIGRESDMHGLGLPIEVAADECARVIEDLAPLVGLFDVVNIKLDKCGGLTHGLAMAAEARRLGFKVMVGNMSGTSWAQAPSFVIGQSCDVVDLDGPLLLARDRSPGVVYEDGHVWCADEVWGGAV